MIPSTITKEDVHQQKIIPSDFTQPNTSGGFTLVELMVSLTIFSIVMLVSIGTLLIMVDVNAKAQALYTATTNLSFALDNITREMRMGYNYTCRTTAPLNLPSVGIRKDCNDADLEYKFVSFVREKDGSRVGYKILNGAIEEKIVDKDGQEVVDWTKITSPDVIITRFNVFVDGAAESYFTNGNLDQPYVDLIIEGYVNNGLETDTDFSIQSRIVQRRLDLI